MGKAPASLDDVILEMVALQRGLPPRPSLPEIELALSTINTINESLAAKIEEVLRQPRPPDVLSSVFDALQEMRKEALDEQSQEATRASETVIRLERRHRRYDGWIQQAYDALSPRSESESSVGRPSEGSKQNLVSGKKVERASEISGSDIDSEVFTPEGSITSASQLSSAADEHDSKWQRISKPSAFASADSLPSLARSSSWSSLRGETKSRFADSISEEKTSSALAPSPHSPDLQNTFNVLSMLEFASKRKQKSLDLHGAFLKEMEWVPESLGKLTWLTDLNLSGNRLSSLPESIGELSNLINLDLSANQLKELPVSLGQLTRLETLNIEKNKIEELPWTIGECTALVELNAGFNVLRGLPEATGRLTQLRSLYVNLNSIKSLPTTISSMTSLTDLDVHFNQLEAIPESLCQVTTLTRLNVSSNFSDLTELPQQIGKLQKLKVLNIGNNHLTVLPDSFAMLTNLQELELEGNPLRIPPLHIAQQGKEAVLKYMADHVSSKQNVKIIKPKKSWLSKLCYTCGSSFPNDDLNIRA